MGIGGGERARGRGCRARAWASVASTPLDELEPIYVLVLGLSGWVSLLFLFPHAFSWRFGVCMIFPVIYFFPLSLLSF